jgi:hypothetical protein
MLQLDLWERDPEILRLQEIERFEKKAEKALNNVRRSLFGKAEDLKNMILEMKKKDTR